jgi:carbon-monoxide dehydrogenase small subunit
MLRMKVNGATRDVDAPPLARLLDVIRGPLGLGGTREGCADGDCGACTVLLDGDPVNSCLVAAGQCDGHELTTVEGLGHRAGALARYFSDACDVCAAGMLVMAEVLLRDNHAPTEVEVREAIAGNRCRCNGHERMVGAILQAATEMNASHEGDA